MIPIILQTIDNEDDRDFMEQFYIQYERLLYREVSKITKNYWDSEDIIQSLLTKIIANEKIPLLRRLDERKRINYFITACHNTAYNYIRKKRNIPLFADEHCESDNCVSSTELLESSLDEKIVMDEDISMLLNIWRSMDKRTQYLLEAKYILDESTSEIAEVLQISPAHVRTLISRAKVKMKKQLKDSFQQ